MIMMAMAAFVCCICVGVGIYFYTKGGDSPAPAPASAPSFPQTVQLTDPSFEGYSPAIQGNTGYGGHDFAKMDTGSSWTTVAGSWIGKSGNNPWGGSPASDGDVYAVLQSVASVQQSVTVVPGGVYTVSWKERGRVGWPEGAKNDLNVSINGTSVYTETNITDTGAWVSKTSSPWTAPAGITTAILKFYSTNPMTGDHSVFIDNVSMSRTS